MDDQEILSAYRKMMYELMAAGSGEKPTDGECLMFLASIVKQWRAWRSEEYRPRLIFKHKKGVI